MGLEWDNEPTLDPTPTDRVAAGDLHYLAEDLDLKAELRRRRAEERERRRAEEKRQPKKKKTPRPTRRLDRTARLQSDTGRALADIRRRLDLLYDEATKLRQRRHDLMVEAIETNWSWRDVATATGMDVGHAYREVTATNQAKTNQAKEQTR